MKRLFSRLYKLFFTPIGTRMSAKERAESRGVALLIVMIGLVLVSAIVVDFGYDETVRYRVAKNTSDSIRAEALAAGGLAWGRMFVAIQGKLQDLVINLAKMSPKELPAFTIWEMMPLDSDKLKTLTKGELESMFFGRDMNEIRSERAKRQSENPDQGEKLSDYRPPEGGFGGFDGRFTLAITDEESKISLQEFGSTTDAQKRRAIRELLAALIVPSRYDDIFSSSDPFADSVDRATVIANIFDWLDANDQATDPYEQSDAWGRTGSNSETGVYANMRGILPKNAYFDTLDEMRLVRGVTDEFEASFFDALTIYGQGGKINILSAKDQVVEALMRYCALDESRPLFEGLSFANDLLVKWRNYPNQGGSMSVDGFLSFLEGNEIKVDKARCQKVTDVRSKTFKLVSSATVGDVTRTLTMVVGPPASGATPVPAIDSQQEIYYFRNR